MKIPNAFLVKIKADNITSAPPLNIPPTSGIDDPTAYLRVLIPIPSTTPALNPLTAVKTVNIAPTSPVTHYIKPDKNSIKPLIFISLFIFEIIDKASIVVTHGKVILQINEVIKF